MKNKGISWLKQDYHFILILILLLGILLRTVYLTQYPAGVNQDEAYAAYEAYAMMESGVDSHGYVNPVYFISWGTGMNVLYSYLSMIFIKIGGLSILTMRMAQSIMGCISLFVFYLFLKELGNKKFAYFGTFILAINPWHIMLSRWGLESNLTPAFLLLGMYFLIRAIKGKIKCYIPAGIFLGLTLYCYAITWLFIPLVLVIFFIYGLYYKRFSFNRYLVIGVALLAIIATPLLLFVAVNNGMVSEINTPLFSIPEMSSIRVSEVSFDNFREKVKVLLKLVIYQSDGLQFNSPNVGIYYYCSIPFMIIGVVKAVIDFCKNLWKKQFEANDMMLLWFGVAMVVGSLLTELNVNKINCLHYSVLYFTMSGCMLCIEKISKKLIYPIVVLYLVFFGVFCNWYFDSTKIDFFYGYEDALNYAEDITDGEIGVIGIYYPVVLMHSQMLPDEYLEQNSYDKNYRSNGKFGRYQFVIDPNYLDENTVYVLPEWLITTYLTGNFSVAYDNGNYLVITCQ